MKHTDLISAIVQAEQQAQSLAAEAKRKKLHLREELRADTEELRKKYAEQANQRICDVLTQENEYTDESIQRINESHRVEMDAMEKLYTENRSAWIEKIYSMVIEPSS